MWVKGVDWSNEFESFVNVSVNHSLIFSRYFMRFKVLVCGLTCFCCGSLGNPPMDNAFVSSIIFDAAASTTGIIGVKNMERTTMMTVVVLNSCLKVENGCPDCFDFIDRPDLY